MKAGGGKIKLLKTFDFGSSLMTKAAIGDLCAAGYFPEGRARPPGDETVPLPEKNEAMVFKDLFTCGLRSPVIPFLRLVLESFRV